MCGRMAFARTACFIYIIEPWISALCGFYCTIDFLHWGFVCPGGHSVMWEQACASKTPCVFNYWDGMEHLNNGGNCICTSLKTEEEISNAIQELFQTDAYEKMKGAALSEKTDIFRYSEIAKKSLECATIRK